MRCAVLTLLIVTLLPCAALFAQAAAPVYRAGYEWNRQKLYGVGPKDSSPEGNPQRDDEGSLVFTYAAVMAPAYGDADHSLRGKAADRWYCLPRATMEWKKRFNEWRFNSATINDKSITHAARAKGNDYTNVPVIIWTNPAGNGARVRIEGVYTIKWTAEMDADLLVAFHDVSKNEWRELSPTARYARPNDRDSLRLTVDPVEQDVDVNDEIVISVRAAEPDDREMEFVSLEDQVRFTLVPRPAAQAKKPTTPTHSATSAKAPPVVPTITRKVENNQLDPTTMTIVLVIAGVIVNGAFVVLFNRWRKGKRVRGLE